MNTDNLKPLPRRRHDPIYDTTVVIDLFKRLKEAEAYLSGALICIHDDPCVEDFINSAAAELTHLTEDMWNVTMEVCPRCEGDRFVGPDKEECPQCNEVGFVTRSSLHPYYNGESLVPDPTGEDHDDVHRAESESQTVQSREGQVGDCDTDGEHDDE